MEKRFLLPVVLPVISGFVCQSCAADESNLASDDTHTGDDDGKQDETPADPERPNILLILVDDVGYSDFGCYGSEISTPNIDRLAQQGIRTRCFYNQARSAPTRASLLTGLYPHQVGYGSLKALSYPAYQGYVNEDNAMIPEVLESAGYFSFMTGKWHLGFGKGVTPIGRGFDRSLDVSAGELYFWNDPDTKAGKTLHWNDQKISYTDERLPDQWYSSDLWAEVGMKFAQQAIDADKPFFWYLPYVGAHFPLQAPAETIAKYRGKYMNGWEEVRKSRFVKQRQTGLFEDAGELTPLNPKTTDWDSLTDEEKDRYDLQMAIYAAVIEEIDKSIGKILDWLEEKGELDNTLIILMSDNGGNAEPGMEGRCEGDDPGAAGSTVYLGGNWANAANTPYFLYKHHAHQGGCNTPFIVSWRDGIDESLWGTLRKDTYAHVIDIMPTLVEITGAEYPTERDGHTVPSMEGTSLVPLLEGRDIDGNRPIIVEHEGNKMLRKGRWKIVQEYRETEWRLYDLEVNPTEMVNLAGECPDVLDDMISEYRRMADHTGVLDLDEFSVGKWYTPVDEYPGME